MREASELAVPFSFSCEFGSMSLMGLTWFIKGDREMIRRVLSPKIATQERSGATESFRMFHGGTTKWHAMGDFDDGVWTMTNTRVFVVQTAVTDIPSLEAVLKRLNASFSSPTVKIGLRLKSSSITYSFQKVIVRAI